MGPGRSLLRQWPPRHICGPSGASGRRLPTTLAGSARSFAAADGSDADLEAGEALQRDAGLVQDLLDGLLVVLARTPARADVVLEEAVDAPSTIFGRAASGLPSSRVVSSATRRSFSTTSAGTSSRVRYFGAKAAMCCATSLATSAFVLVQLDQDADLRGQVGLVRCR